MTDPEWNVGDLVAPADEYGKAIAAHTNVGVIIGSECGGFLVLWRSGIIGRVQMKRYLRVVSFA